MIFTFLFVILYNENIKNELKEIYKIILLEYSINVFENN